jgi:HEAT repeat protein
MLPAEGKYKDKSQKEWISQLHSPNSGLRIQALQALGEIGAEEGKNASNTKRAMLLAIHKHSVMVPPMIELLKDSDEQVREATVAALIKVGSYAESDL